jgi:myo-inositol 2-dehydrogenase/D-chiro-inositol 1-dehydrogenase
MVKKVGVSGLGRLGARHAANLAARIRGCELTAVHEVDDQRRNELAKEFGVKHNVKTFEELVAIEELDAVIIASPSVYHASQIKQAFEAGKHVFCEKPMGTSMEECFEAKAVAEKHPDLLFMLGFMRRYDESYRYAWEKTIAGDIGKVVLFRGNSQDSAKNIKGAIAYGPKSGGIFIDVAVHDIDVARWFVGSEPTRVWALGGCYANPEFADFNDGDCASATLQFKNGAMGFIFNGRIASQGYTIEAEIIGTKGTLRIGTLPQGNMVEILDTGGVRREYQDNFLDRFQSAYLNEMREFIDCLHENRKPEPGIEEGWRATRIAYKCKEAFETGAVADTGL